MCDKNNQKDGIELHADSGIEYKNVHKSGFKKQNLIHQHNCDSRFDGETFKSANWEEAHQSIGEWGARMSNSCPQ